MLTDPTRWPASTSLAAAPADTTASHLRDPLPRRPPAGKRRGGGVESVVLAEHGDESETQARLGVGSEDGEPFTSIRC